MRLGEVIERIRKGRKLTKTALAEKALIAQSTLYQVINNEGDPRLSTLILLSRALNVSLSSIIREAELLENPEQLIFDQEETFTNCSVQILTNSFTGEQSVGWWRND